jgi:hypothetical protein
MKFLRIDDELINLSLVRRISKMVKGVTFEFLNGNSLSYGVDLEAVISAIRSNTSIVSIQVRK